MTGFVCCEHFPFYPFYKSRAGSDKSDSAYFRERVERAEECGLAHTSDGDISSEAAFAGNNSFNFASSLFACPAL